MNAFKMLWRLGLCTVLVIGFSWGLANASEPGASEKALHEVQETQEEAKHELLEMKGEAQEAAQETTSDCQQETQEKHEDIKEEVHDTKGE